jgi:hypothetical protein
MITPKIPEKLSFFLKEKSRYKVAHGGRGAGGKSWAVVRSAIVRAISERTRILCTREVQNSIKESIYRLIVDQTNILEVQNLFDITDRSIKCKNGSEFIFEGLYRNIDKIKSLEGIDVCICEEAENISEDSWQILLPTIRKKDSEIWIIFNPKFPDDATYARFVTNKPDNCISVKVMPDDNPFFPDVLRLEMEADKAYRPQRYKNVWLGEPVGYGQKIWDLFDSKIHIGTMDWQHCKDVGNLYMAMDPASHYYPACIWCCKLPLEEGSDECLHYIYDEYPRFEDFNDYFHTIRRKILFTGTLSDISRSIYAHDGEGAKILKRFIDTRFALGSGSQNLWDKSTQGIVAEFCRPENGGILFEMPVVTAIDAARSKINDDLKYNTLMHISQFNKPRFLINPCCKNTIDSLMNHRMEEDTVKEHDKYKDFSDTLRILYAGMYDLKYKTKDKPKHVYHAEHGRDGWMG